MSITRSLVERVHEIGFDDLGPEDLEALRALLLDHLSVAARGAQTDSARAAQAFVGGLEVTGAKRIPLIGTQAAAPPAIGSLVNAVAGHSIEYDDLHTASSTHPGVVVFPAALGAAVLADADAIGFLRAATVGYEVMCRVGRAAGPAAQYRRHYHPTATCGHLGAAAAAASAFDLDVDATCSAIGIAATMASGSMQFLEDGSWTKRLHPGLAARAGIQAAQLARAGFEGGKDGIGGPRAFLSMMSDEPRPELALADHGSLELRQTSLKAHTCCRYKQGPIDALLAIRQEHKLEAADVASIRVGLVTAGMDIIAGEAKRRPQNVVDAQFSMPYGAAVALCDGRADLAQYRAERLADADLLTLMDRVECVADPGLDAVYPARWPAWAEVKTRDGRCLRAEVPDPKGDPSNPLDTEERREKFDALCAPVYSAGRRDALWAAAEGLGEAGSLKALIDLLPTEGDAA